MKTAKIAGLCAAIFVLLAIIGAVLGLFPRVSVIGALMVWLFGLLTVVAGITALVALIVHVARTRA